MAFRLLFVLCLSGLIQLSTSQLLKAKLSCLDCTSHYDFSGIKIAVKCANVKKLATAKSEGSLEVILPSGSTPLNCVARIIGGTTQMYAKKKNTVARIVKTQDPSTYTISTPLAFSTTHSGIGESKTIDLPLPSYYVPFFPIIGIP